MKYTLQIQIGRKRINGGVLAYRQVAVRKRLLRFLLGSPVKLTVIIPGDMVDEITIRKVGENDADPY